MTVIDVSGSHRRSWSAMSLLWRVFVANIAVFVVAFALIAWTPITVHRIATPSELLILAVLLVAMLVIDLTLLRRTFEPLRRLAALIGGVDPEHPGQRFDEFEGTGAEVRVVAGALNAMLDRLEGERIASGRRVLEAQEGERRRVARELHDEVGQTLTAIALRAERAAAQAPSQQLSALEEITATALRGLEDVRRIGNELRPEALDDLGLVNALIALCERVGRQGDVRVRRELQWQLPALTGDVELVIYRTAQEALTNVLRHAAARNVTVSLQDDPHELVLRIADDGVGLRGLSIENGLRGSGGCGECASGRW
jgi:two-component system sensor histidine kinase UhpB